MNDLQVPDDSPDAIHEPVLAKEVLDLLNPKPGMVCLDCTLGLGGHAQLITQQLAPGGRYIGLDVDPQNIAIAKRCLADAPVAVDLVQANFASAVAVLDQLGLQGVDLLLADLGFASNQLRDSGRGFSFNVDEPLDMRLDPSLGQTAADLINELTEPELADLIYRYGQDRLSRKIARKIIEHRQESPIKTTVQLAQLLRGVYARTHRGKGRSGSRHRIDPATRTFMALRIAVNSELVVLQRLLDDLPRLLRFGAVAVIISFHSLEDRPTKQAFAAMSRDQQAERLTIKPLCADRDEQQINPRSRSAKLRAIRWKGNQARNAIEC